MNVVYIIGNGFDLQLGLPTSYSDFYQYYTNLESKSESIRKLKEAIKNKPHNWSDLEVALGQYTSQVDSVQSFCNAYDDLQMSLRDYILKVDEMMMAGELTLNTNAKALEEGFTFPEKAFGSDSAYTIDGEYERAAPGFNRGKSIYNANIISFNYTHVIEHFLKDFIEGRHSGTRFLNSVLHVHREVEKNRSIWVGVDNGEQIDREEFRNNIEVTCRVIKPWILVNRNRRLVQDAKQCIKSADVLVIFGASLGLSDMTWVKYITEREKLGIITMLFVYNGKVYPSDNAKLSDQIRYREDFIQKLRENGASQIDDSKIFVEINSSIFTDNTPNNHNSNLNAVLEKLKG